MKNYPLINKVLGGRYKILRVLGEGGMGIVFLGEHVEMGAKVAIKVMRPEFSDEEIFVKRFLREVKASSRLRHPNIITIMDFGKTDDNILYMVMEYLEGKSLQNLIKEEGKIHYKRALNILSQICSAIGEAHLRGIVHRDLKPENIFLLTHHGLNDFVKVLDFGLARSFDEKTEKGLSQITKTGFITGTPHYMSPEQCKAENIDHRSDIYSLGIIMFYMLTGKLPFTGDSVMEIMLKQVNDAVPPLEELIDEEIPYELINLTYWCLEKEKDLRPSCVEEILKEIDNLRQSHISETVSEKSDETIDAKSIERTGFNRFSISSIYKRKKDVKEKTIKPSVLIGGRYFLKEEIGRGSIGKVFRATDEFKNQLTVAVKVIDKNINDETIFRLKEEALILSRLRHERVVSFKDFGMDSGHPYLVMEYCEDGNLSSFMRTFLEIKTVISIIKNITEGLIVAHSKNILHRDLKPSNILFSKGKVKIGDLGLASLNLLKFLKRGNEFVGTVKYVSPEQAGIVPRETDNRSDLYSLGIIFYELLTGEPPFMGATAGQILNQKVSKKPQLPSELRQDVPEFIDNIVMKLLQPFPEHRYQSAEGLYFDLETFEKGQVSNVKAGERDVIINVTTEGKLIARESILNRVDLFLNSIKNHRGFSVLITGQSGTGKTRLAREIALRLMRKKGVYFKAKGHDLGTPVPFGAIKELLLDFLSYFRGLDERDKDFFKNKISNRISGLEGIIVNFLPEFEEIFPNSPRPVTLEGEAELARFINVIVNTVLGFCQDTTTCLIFDDVQWMDSDSINVINNLISMTKNFSTLIVCTARKDRDYHAAQILENQMKKSGGELIEVAPFSVKQTHEYLLDRFNEEIDGLNELAQEVHRLSGGVVMAIKEILRELLKIKVVEKRSDGWKIRLDRMKKVKFGASILETVILRMEGLKDEFRIVLGVAGLLGRPFFMKEIIDILPEIKPDIVVKTLYDSEKKGILNAIEEKGEIKQDFVHDRIREAAILRLTDEEKTNFHGRIAQNLILRKNNGENIDILEIAHNFYEAKKGKEAYDYYYEAAVKAVSIFSGILGVRYAKKALECKKSINISEVVRLRLLLVKSFSLIKKLNEAKEEIENILSERIDEELKVEVLKEYAKLLRVEGNYKKALQVIDDALLGLGVSLPDTKFKIKKDIILKLIRYVFLKSLPRNRKQNSEEQRKLARISELLFIRTELLFFLDDEKMVMTFLWTFKYSLMSKDLKAIAKSYSLGGLIFAMGMGWNKTGTKFLKKAIEFSERSEDVLTTLNAKVYMDLIGVGYAGSSVNYEHTKEILNTAKRVGDLWLIGLAYEVFGEIVFLLGNIEEYLQICYKMQTEVVTSKYFEQLHNWANSMLVWAANELGFFDIAAIIATKGTSLSQKHSDKLTELFFTINHFKSLCYLGKYKEAEEKYKDVERLLREKIPKRSLAETFRPLLEGMLKLISDGHEIKTWKKRINAVLKLGFRMSRSYVCWYNEILMFKAVFKIYQNRKRQGIRLLKKAYSSLLLNAPSHVYRLGQILVLLAELHGGNLTSSGKKFLNLAESTLKGCSDSLLAKRRLFELKGSSNSLEKAKKLRAKFIPFMTPEELPEDLKQWNEKTVAEPPTSSFSIKQKKQFDYLKKFSAMMKLPSVKTLHEILAKAIEVTGADRGYVLVKKENDFVVIAQAKSIEGGSSQTEFLGSKSVCNQCFSSKTAIKISDATKNSSYSTERSVVARNIQAIVCHPIMYKNRMIGVLYLDNRFVSEIFDDSDMEFLESTAGICGVILNEIL